MSLLIDTNILIYAFNKDALHHVVCREFVESKTRGTGISLTWSILYEFLRVATHPKVMTKPLDSKTAIRAIQSLIEDANIGILTETPLHARFLDRVMQSIPSLQGNLFHDVHIAAIMLEHGIQTIVTADRHFRLFPALQIIDPTRHCG